jgi:hypothetical protein
VSEPSKEWDAVFDQMDKTFEEADRAFRLADKAFKVERTRMRSSSSSSASDHSFRFTAATWRQRVKLGFQCVTWALRAIFKGEITISIKRK